MGWRKAASGICCIIIIIIITVRAQAVLWFNKKVIFEISSPCLTDCIICFSNSVLLKTLKILQQRFALKA